MQQNLSVPPTIQTAREITLAEICSTFIDEELLSCSAMTRTWYRCRLGLFIEQMGGELNLSAIDKAGLIRWWRTLEARTSARPPTLSIETFHGYVRAVRRLLKWLYENNLIITDLAKVLKLPKIPRRTRRGTTDDVVERILFASQENLRDHAIFQFLESTGCRRGGIVTLRIEDIDLDAPEPYCRQVTVHEKGLKDRTVFMSADALAAMRAWMKVRKSKTDYVFVDERPGHDCELLPGAINQLIERYKKKLGITSSGNSPHQWRHRRSRILLKNGMPLNLVAEVLGHSTVVVTAAYYGNLVTDELHRAFDRFSKSPEKPSS